MDLEGPDRILIIAGEFIKYTDKSVLQVLRLSRIFVSLKHSKSLENVHYLIRRMAWNVS